MHSKQSHLRALAPILAEQCSSLFEYFRIQLRRHDEGVRPGNGGEIFVTQFYLNGTGVQTAFPQPAAYHFGKSHKRGFQLLLTGGIFVISMLVADRLGITVSPNFRIEPSSSILAAGFTGQRQAPLPKAFFKERIIEAG